MRRALFLLLLLYTALLPFERLWETLANVDTVFKPYRLLGLLMLPASWLWLFATGRRVRLDVGDKSYLLIFGWGVAMALFWSAVSENDLEYTTRALPIISFGVAMYFFTKNLALSLREIEQVLVAYIFGIMVSVVYAFSLGPPPGRFRGMANNPNGLAMAASIGFIFLLAQFLYQARPRLRWQLARIAATITMVGLIGLSGSRGAAAATAVASAVLLVLALRPQLGTRGRGATRMSRVLMFSAVCGVALMANYDRIEASWEQQEESKARFDHEYAAQSADDRWDLWRSGWNVGLDHVGLGAGMMQYMAHHTASIRQLPDISNKRLTRRPLATHSDYVDLFACYGVVGLGAFAYYIRRLFRAIRRQLARPDDDDSGQHLIPFSLALLCALLVHGITMNSFLSCDYYMAMAIAHTIAWLPRRSAPKVSAAPEPVQQAPQRVRLLAHQRSV